MKLINSNVMIIPQEPGLLGIYKAIESAGRTCYKSEDKITSDSAKEFVDKMISLGHTAMLEFGTVYLVKEIDLDDDDPTYELYNYNPYSAVVEIYNTTKHTVTLYITTNYRVLVENGWLDDLKYQCEPTVNHYKRACARFICDRGVSHKRFVA
jgi:thymidylate synthase (FAD)